MAAINVPYGTHPRQVLDVWPPKAGCPLPASAVVWLHGHKWQQTGKDLLASDPVRRLGNRCLFVVAVEYRQAPDSLFPAGVRDVKQALRWVRAYGAAFGIAPAKVGVWGFSAGAQLGALVAASCGDAWLGLGTPDECVDALVAWSGPHRFWTEDTELLAIGCAARAGLPGSPEALWLGEPVAPPPSLSGLASPLSYATRPPARFAAGTQDCSIPWRQSVAADSAWAGASTLNLYDAGHFRTGPVWGADSVQVPVGKFFAQLLGGR